MRFGIPVDRAQGLKLARVEAREDLRDRGAADDKYALDFERIGGYAVPPKPCGECAHFRFSSGQEMLSRVSTKLDMHDIGWGRFHLLQSLGRCALQDNLLTHKVATCDRWTRDDRHRGRSR